MSDPIRVLYVDDYPLDRELVRDALEREHEGFQVTEAASRQEFEARLAEGDYDLVLSDFNILGFEGLQVIDAIQAKDPRVPVVIVTGTGSEEVAVEAMKRGAADYVIKTPKHIRRLPLTIHAALEKKQLAEEREHTEAVLRESESKYRTLVEHIPQKIFTKDRDSVYVSCNENFARDLGIKPDQIVGRTDYDFFPSELADKYRADDKRSMETGQTEDLEEKYLQAGQEVWVQTLKTPIRQEDGRVIGILGVFWDITERKRAERLLQALNEAALAMEQALTQEEIFAAVAEEFKELGFSCAVFLADESQSRLFPKYLSYAPRAIKAAEKLTGFQHESFSIPIENVDMYREVVWERKTIWVENVEEVTRQWLPEPLKRFAGQIVRVLKVPKAINTSLVVEDKVIGLLSVQSDDLTEDDAPAITAFAHQVAAALRKAQLFEQAQQEIAERKRAEDALREAHERFLTVLDGIDAHIYAADMETYEILYMNKQMRNDFGDDLVGKICWKVFRGESGPCAHCTNDKLVDADGKATGVVIWEGQNPVTGKWYMNYDRAITWVDGRLVRLQVATDITERKQLEAQLLQMQKMEAVGQLAAGIAHDFNNLLTPIGGFADLLLGKAPAGSKQQAYLRQIKVAAERAADLTGQLRLFTRQARGERRSIQLNSVVEETCDLLKRSIPKEIAIELGLESELWAVEADPSQTSQVLMNLCINARDAMPEGGTLTLETSNVTLDEEWARAILEAQPGRYVRLSVSDSGCGMSAEVQARLFEPFFTTKEVGEGTGLGLAMVYGIVKGHDGFIQVYSQEGRGSTFHVYLPAVERVEEREKVEELELPTGTETILFVDDEEMVRALGQAVLGRCGYTVLMAEDGVQALEVYQAHKGEIPLVVLDVVMPQMDGRECLRRLREMDPGVKVLISTGYTARGLAEELVAEGALGVVEKPFKIQDFATAVRATIDE